MLENTNQNRIKHLRTRAKMTLRELEEKTGLGYAFLSRLENGKITLTNDVADKLANFFNVSTEYLLGENLKERVDNFMRGIEIDYTYINIDKNGDASRELDRYNLTDREVLILKLIYVLGQLEDNRLANVLDCARENLKEQLKEEFENELKNI